MPYLPYDLTNVEATTVGSALTTTATSLSVVTGGGAILGAAGGVPYFVLIGAASGKPEVAQVTAVSTDTLTLVRGVNGVVSAWAVGTTVQVAVQASSDQLYAAVAQVLSLASTPAYKGNAPVATGAAGTVATAGISVSRVNPAASRTACVLAPGTVDGQMVIVENQAASFSLTMDVAGTSNVADGASTVIAALTAVKFIWDAAKVLWYRVV